MREAVTERCEEAVSGSGRTISASRAGLAGLLLLLAATSPLWAVILGPDSLWVPGTYDGGDTDDMLALAAGPMVLSPVAPRLADPAFERGIEPGPARVLPATLARFATSARAPPPASRRS